jgi:hypothetical protein
MTVSRLTIDKVFARMAVAGMQPPRNASPDAAAEFWTAKLRNYSPQDVEAAFERWIETGDKWPMPKDILPLVNAQQSYATRAVERRNETQPPRRRRKHETAESIYQTCSLLEAVRAQPQNYMAPAAVVKMGEQIIAEHIQLGHAPPDVARIYGHLVETYPLPELE